MAKPLRIQFEGAIYHVMNRGVARQLLFWDKTDFNWFQECLAIGVERFHVRIYLFCMMPNHYHLLVETPLANLSQFMLSIQTRYGRFYNIRHKRQGYVFQGRYRAKLVEGDRYLLKLSRYLHLNPIETKAYSESTKAQKTAALRAYPWSSYPGYIRKTARKPWVTYGPVEGQVMELVGQIPNGYRHFVETGIARRDADMEEAVKRSHVGIGGSDFVASIKQRAHLQLMARGKRIKETFRQTGTWLPKEDIIPAVCATFGVTPADLERRRGGGLLRSVAAAMFTQFAGLSQMETAQQLGLTSNAAVSSQLKILSKHCAKDPQFNAAVQRLEGQLKKKLFAR